MSIFKGIKTNLLDSSLYVANLPSAEVAKKTSLFGIPDALRFRNASLWTANNNNLEFVNKDNVDKLIDIQFSGDTITIKANKSYFNNFVLIDGVIQEIFSPYDWKNFIFGTQEIGNFVGESYGPLVNFENNRTEVFFDHYHQIDKQVENSSNENNSSPRYYEGNFVYNFNSPQFEKTINEVQIKESALPNLYYLISVANSFSRMKNERSFPFQQTTLGGQIQSTLYKNIFTNYDNEELQNLYFEEFAKYLQEPQTNLVLSGESTKSKDIIYESELFDYPSKMEGLAIPTPFYSKIKFIGDSINNSMFLTGLTDVGLQNSLLDSFINQSQNTKAGFIVNEANNSFVLEQLNIFDFKQWFKESLKNTTLNPTNNYTEQEKFSTNVGLISLAGRIIDLTNQKLRTLKEVFDGKPAHVETVFYKIEKFVNTTKGEPIQKFYFFLDKKELIHFYDTQIKFNKRYAYKVYACNVVIGNQYNYENYYTNKSSDKDLNNDLRDGIFKVKFKNVSSIKIIETPIFDFIGQIVEGPITNPDVQIIQAKNNSNEIKISLTKDLFKKAGKATYINEKDFNYYKIVKELQKTDDLVYYNNTKKAKKVEVYKTDKRPKFYSDLDGYLFTTLDVFNDNLTFIDKLPLEQKIYYAFRFLNDHGNPSKISEIYETTLKDDDGLTYLNLNKIDLESEVFSQDNKPFRRFVLVKPNIKQTLVANTPEELVKLYEANQSDQINLGISEETVWNKTFKLRIRSKKSGKVIDVNFKFSNNQKVTESSLTIPPPVVQVPVGEPNSLSFNNPSASGLLGTL